MACSISKSSIRIHRDVDLYAGIFEVGEGAGHAIAAGRRGWLQVAQGAVTLNGETLYAGDGVAIEGAAELDIRATEDAEVLLFDMG